MNTTLGFFPYEAMNYKAAQAWLDRKAEQGWGLRHIYLGCVARFQRAEKPSHFVDLDIRSAFDDDTDADYLQLCSDAGWELVQQLRGMLLFRAVPGKAPAPIQTDGELEWERFWERYRPRIWSTLLLLVGLGLLALLLVLPAKRNLTAALALNSGLICLLYLALYVLFGLWEWGRSRRYLARCRRSGRVEPPGALATLSDSICRLRTPLLLLILVFTLAEPFGFGKTVDLNWYPINEEYAATVEACREWPVVLASDLGLPDSGDSRHLEGFGSVLVDFLEYRELTDGEGPDASFHILTTERYACLNEPLARWVIGQRREETRKGAFLWGELPWEPAPDLGFDECYACRTGSYLLLRQGRVVALVGCTGSDLTTRQSLEAIQARVLGQTEP